MPVLEDNRVALGLRWSCIAHTANSALYESEKGDRLSLSINKLPMLNERELPEYVGDLNAVLDDALNQQFIHEHRILRGARSLVGV